MKWVFRSISVGLFNTTGYPEERLTKLFSHLPRTEVIKAIERRYPSRIPLVMAKWLGEGFEALHGKDLEEFDKYPDDVAMYLIEPFEYEKMGLPWKLNLSGAYDTRCLLDVCLICSWIMLISLSRSINLMMPSVRPI
jgi:hypothetical protein